jgi:hypothetical protein
MRNKIDLKYRPHSYFWAKEIGVQLSSQVKGAERISINYLPGAWGSHHL